MQNNFAINRNRDPIEVYWSLNRFYYILQKTKLAGFTRTAKYIIYIQPSVSKCPITDRNG